MTVWKFGCNWERNPNSFYDFIKDEDIALGRAERTPFEVGDLVLITSGFLVRAIVRIENDSRPITSEPRYRNVREDYGIAYDEATIFSKAEWYELPEQMQFQYEVQRGAARVWNQDVLNIAIELWENRPRM